jgi:serine/threonine protein kinase
MARAPDLEITLIDDTKWGTLTDLFERLLAGDDPETVLASEPDPEIREAAGNLWRHHVRAAQEDFLGDGLGFEVLPVFQPGQMLMNRFRIEQKLGSGGMGEVYLAPTTAWKSASRSRPSPACSPRPLRFAAGL